MPETSRLSNSAGQRGSLQGHFDPFPPPRLNGWCRFSLPTFGGATGNGRDAPIAVTGKARWIGSCRARNGRSSRGIAAIGTAPALIYFVELASRGATVVLFQENRKPDGFMPALNHRHARLDDVPRLNGLIDAAIEELQRGFLTPMQVEASGALMGIDTQLIEDGTYFLVEAGQVPVGCGGWSRRATLYGGDHSPGREPKLRDPGIDPARVLCTAPRFARKGIGRLILGLCEDAAAAEGFLRIELVATLAGEPLYAACGYQVVDRFEDTRGGIAVPLVKMGRDLRA